MQWSRGRKLGTVKRLVRLKNRYAAEDFKIDAAGHFLRLRLLQELQHVSERCRCPVP